MLRYTDEEIEEIKRNTPPEVPLFLYGSKSRFSNHYLAQATGLRMGGSLDGDQILATYERADGSWPGSGYTIEGAFSRTLIDASGFAPLTPAAEDVLAEYLKLSKERLSG